MHDFNAWLARCTDRSDEAWSFARQVAAVADWPTEPDAAYPHFYLSVYNLEGPTRALDEGRAVRRGVPDIPTLERLWNRYVRESLGPAPVPPELTGEARALGRALENGSLREVAELLATELEPGQRDLLLSRAMTVCRVSLSCRTYFGDEEIPDDGCYDERAIPEDQALEDRVGRMSTFVVVTHPAVSQAVKWLSRSPLDDEALAGLLHRRDPEWLREFTRGAGSLGYVVLTTWSRYGLIEALVRDFGVGIDPTGELAGECLSRHVGRAADVSDAVIGERLRNDPMATVVLPALRAACEAVRHELCVDGTATKRTIRVAVERGLVDRKSLVDALVDTLRSEAGYPYHQADELLSLLEYLEPTDEELTAHAETWAEISTKIQGMNKQVLGRAVTVLAGEGRISQEQVAEWIRTMCEEPAGLAANAQAAIELLADDHRYMTEERAAEVLRIVVDGPSGKAAAVLTTCVRKLMDAGWLTDEQITACAREVLFRPERALVQAMIQFLGRMLSHDPGRVAVLLPLLTEAFAHPSPDVQESAFVLAAKYRDRLTAPLLELLGAAAEHMTPALRPRVAEAFGVPLTDTAVPAESDVLPSVTAPQRLASPAAELADAVERISVWLRGRSQEAAHWERALDDLVRHAHRERTELARVLMPLLKSLDVNYSHSLLLRGEPVLAAVAVVEASGLSLADHRITDHTLSCSDPRHRKAKCGHTVLDDAHNARLDEIARRILDGDPPPLLLSTPTWEDGTLDAVELIGRLQVYRSLDVRPGAADFDQALLRVRHDERTGSAAAEAAEALGGAEAERLAAWLRRGGLPPVGTRRHALEPLLRVPNHHSPEMPAHLREEIIGTTEGLDGFSEAFRNLFGPSPAATLACPCYWYCGTEAIRASVPLWLTFLPAHREIVTARILPVFTEGAELDNASATVHLPRLVDTGFPLGSVAHLALAHGLSASRPQERVAATDALLLMAARGSLDPTRLGRDLAGLAACGTLKLGRLTECLSSAAQGGGHRTVASVVAATLHGLLPAPGAKVPAGLAALLNLAAECAEHTASTPPIEGIAELAARKGSSLFLKAARRLHAACAAPA